jgi:hypothetical protein
VIASQLGQLDPDPIDAVVDHFDKCMSLNLTGGQKSDLVQYLKSL